MHWNWRTFDELTNLELYKILGLRQEVFVLEQKCQYVDVDGLDLHSMHLLGMQDNELVAYLRVLPKDLAYPNAISFGRVLIAAHYRKQQLGKQMIAETLRYLPSYAPHVPIIISAQAYLEKFYKTFGFESVGEPYDEAGISHIKMKLCP